MSHTSRQISTVTSTTTRIKQQLNLHEWNAQQTWHTKYITATTGKQCCLVLWLQMIVDLYTFHLSYHPWNVCHETCCHDQSHACLIHLSSFLCLQHIIHWATLHQTLSHNTKYYHQYQSTTASIAGKKTAAKNNSNETKKMCSSITCRPTSLIHPNLANPLTFWPMACNRLYLYQTMMLIVCHFRLGQFTLYGNT